MKTCITILLLLISMSLAAATTEFTYQGQLKDAGVPATGSYDLEFKLFDAVTAGAQVVTTPASVLKPGATVTNGLFTVTLDFGQNVFTGAERWLEVGVRGTALPRQKISATPYAINSFTVSDGAITPAKIASLPKCRVFSTVAQPLATNSAVPISFDATPRYDTDNMFNAATPTRLTCNTAGVYRIFGHASFDNTTQGGLRQVYIYLNGTIEIGISTQTLGNGSGNSNSVSTEYKLNVGDYVELRPYQSSGAVINTGASGATTQHGLEFGISYVP